MSTALFSTNEQIWAQKFSYLRSALNYYKEEKKKHHENINSSKNICRHKHDNSDDQVEMVHWTFMLLHMYKYNSEVDKILYVKFVCQIPFVSKCHLPHIPGDAAAAAVTAVVSDSVQPNIRQPTRLCRPWDSPGKNTGMGCHFLLHCMKVKSASEVTQSCPTLHEPMDCSLPGSPVHGFFQGRILE